MKDSRGKAYEPSPMVRPGVCSHVWRDLRYFGQLVFNRDVAPWAMQQGRVYRCVNCLWELHP